MANRVIGLDIGSWAVKAVALELEREVSVVGYRELLLSEFEEVSTPPAGGGVEPPGDGPVEAPVRPMGGGEEGGEAGEAPGLRDDELVENDWAREGPVEFVDEREPWLQALSRLQAEGFFEGVNRVVATLPGGQAMVLHVEVPFDRHDTVASILPNLLADQLPMSAANVVSDFFVIPGKGPGLWEALVGVAERTAIGEFLTGIQSVGLDPAVLGVPELMLRHGVGQVADSAVQSYGVIDFGHSETHLVIVDAGRPVMARTVRNAGAMLTQELAGRFNLSLEDAERLKHQRGAVGRAVPADDGAMLQLGQALEGAMVPVIRDLRRTFQAAYAKYKVAVDVIYLCGGSSRIAGLEEYLRGEFQVDVQMLQFSGTLDFSGAPEARARTPEAAQALGTALQAFVDRQENRSINFRKGEFVYRGKSSYLRAQVSRLAIVAVVLLVMFIGVLVMQRMDQQAQLRAMQAALAVQTQELFGEALRSPADVQVRLAGEAGPDRDFVPQMSAYEVMYRITEQISGSSPLTLERIEVDTDRNLVQIVGVTDSPQSVDRIANEIGALECLRNVQQERVNVQREGEVQFELQINSRCS